MQSFAGNVSVRVPILSRFSHAIHKTFLSEFLAFKWAKLVKERPRNSVKTDFEFSFDVAKEIPRRCYGVFAVTKHSEYEKKLFLKISLTIWVQVTLISKLGNLSTQLTELYRGYKYFNRAKIVACFDKHMVLSSRVREIVSPRGRSYMKRLISLRCVKGFSWNRYLIKAKQLF